jgi:tRNA/rRNA methyltransferase
LVVGTTAVGERTLQHPLHVLPEAGGMIGEELAREGGQVALLFGSEKTGLSNDELSHCHWLLTIPMEQHEDVRHPSMNLGQAVAVCLYELVRQSGAAVTAGGGVPATAEAGEVERLTALLTEVLEGTGYTKRHPANCDEGEIRRLVLRMGIAASDVPVWMGILRQVLWKVRRSGED